MDGINKNSRTFDVGLPYMNLRKSILLIRALLIALCVQFTITVLLPMESGKDAIHSGLTEHKLAKPGSVSSLIEKTEKESEENERTLAVEWLDLTAHFFLRITSEHTPIRKDFVSFHNEHPPIFTLHCNYRI
jgi:hypothetical protein